MGYVTKEIAALVGVPGPTFTAGAPLGADDLRRFVQGVMEQDPVHWDEGVAHASRYGGVVAPPLYVLHAFRRGPGTPDPFERFADEPEWDGLDVGFSFGGLPKIDVPLTRVLNGGTEAEFFRLPRVGDTISGCAQYVSIVDREGRSGAMVLATIETVYTNQDDEKLAVVRSTVIMR